MRESGPPRSAQGRDSIPRLELPSDPGLEAVIAALRAHEEVSDAEFDALFPPWVRARSERHWTSVAVALRAARFLAEEERARVLDVGSGPGKFCLLGASSTAAEFTGVERRRHLAQTARELARRYGIERAHFLSGDLRELAWGDFTGFYFYNPFAENRFGQLERIDDTVELNPARFELDLAFVLEQLARAPAGTRVAIYCGLGADPPVAYDLVGSEWFGAYELELWQKTRA